MKGLKRIATIFLACVLFFTVVGCNDNTQPVKEDNSIMNYYEMGMKTYKTKYVNTPFFSDRNDNVTYAANALWEKFGSVTDGTNAVTPIGGPSWYEWNTLKLMWSNSSLKGRTKAEIIAAPMDESGYMWSWWNLPHWENNDNVYHYDINPRYIASVYDVCAWENSVEFLSEVDNTEITAAELPFGQEAHIGQDKSKGKTVWQKTEMAMNYMLNELNGKNGLIIISNPLNTGELNSSSSNYWDNLPFGYKDPYEGALFLNALDSMQGLYLMQGNTAKAEEYGALMLKVKEEFDKTYWDANKQRYVSNIDKNNVSRDYGLTFQNIEALHYGLGNEEKAKSIYSWLDGERIIDGDTSTGKDIYDAFAIAPRSNTVKIESQFEQIEGKRKAWWHGPSSIDPFTSAKYGTHLENGGAILYVSYYDMMTRLKYFGADNALGRFNTIAKEYAKDELMRDPSNSFGNKWIIGIIGEFPESGLVPLTYLNGFLGINATHEGLEIKPNIPTDYKTMGVNEVVYGGATYKVTVNKGEKITLESVNAKNLNLVLSNFKDKKDYTATITKADGSAEKVTLTEQNGSIKTTFALSGNIKIEIE